MDNDLKWLPILDIDSGAVGGGNVIIYDNTNKRFMALDDDNKKIPHVLTFSGGTAISKRKQDVIWCIWIGRKITILLRYWRTLRTRKCMCMESGLEIMG